MRSMMARQTKETEKRKYYLFHVTEVEHVCYPMRRMTARLTKETEKEKY